MSTYSIVGSAHQNQALPTQLKKKVHPTKRHITLSCRDTIIQETLLYDPQETDTKSQPEHRQTSETLKCNLMPLYLDNRERGHVVWRGKGHPSKVISRTKESLSYWKCKHNQVCQDNLSWENIISQLRIFLCLLSNLLIQK